MTWKDWVLPIIFFLIILTGMLFVAIGVRPY